LIEGASSGKSTYTLALTGDVIMNSRVSVCDDEDVLAVVELLRGADVTHAHLEIPLHDFGAADVFGAAEGALSWMRGPTTVAHELRWLGVDLVSAASNHALDYSTPPGWPMRGSAPTWRRRAPRPSSTRPWAGSRWYRRRRRFRPSPGPALPAGTHPDVPA